MSSISFLKKKKNDLNNVVVVYPFTYINPYFALPPIAAEYLQAGIIDTGRNATLLDMRYEVDIKEHLEKADLVCLYGYYEDCSIFVKWRIHVINEILSMSKRISNSLQIKVGIIFKKYGSGRSRIIINDPG